MKGSDINLMRDRVPSPAARKAIYLAFLGYLGVAGGFLAWEANRSARLLEAAGRQRTDMAHLHNEFRARHDTGEELDATAALLEKRLRETTTRLDRVAAAARSTLSPARLLIGLEQPLPRALRLSTLTLDTAARRAEFSITEPVADQVTLLHARELIEMWLATPLLSAEVETIEPLGTERSSGTDGSVMLHRFAARLKPRQGG